MANGFAEDHTYKSGNQKLEGYVIDKGKNAPLVFLVHDWDGIDEYEKKRSQMIADLGYSVFAMDLFGKGVRPQKTEDKINLVTRLYKDRKKMRELMNVALVEAKEIGLSTNKAIVIGYCFGGTAVLEWAKSGIALNGFVSFHGGLKPEANDSYKSTKSEILVFHGSADESVSLQDFSQLAELLEKEHIPHEMITYSGAPHAFTKFDSDRYRKNADEKSWSRFVVFLKDHLLK